MTVPADYGEEDLTAEARKQDRVKELLEGKSIVKVITVPGRLVNIVVR